MNTKQVVLLVLVVSVFLIGCSSKSPTGDYASYNQPQQQNQYVGGGCGVAQNAEYTDMSNAFDGKSSAA